jgi:sRNA-binding regulator protein Hfq
MESKPMSKKARSGYPKSRWRDGIADSILRSSQVEEQTFAEPRYLNNLIHNRTPVTLKLVNDEEINGWIEYYDKNMIRVTRDGQANVFLFKDRIKYIIEQ